MTLWREIYSKVQICTIDLLMTENSLRMYRKYKIENSLAKNMSKGQI